MLFKMLHLVQAETGEKIVIVSHYTQVSIVTKRGWKSLGIVWLGIEKQYFAIMFMYMCMCIRMLFFPFLYM